MSIEIPSVPISKNGDFLEIAYDWNAKIKDYFNKSVYDIYGFTDKDYKQYRNPSAPVDLKIMSIGDSFGNIPFMFLPMIFASCDELDMRHYKDDFNEYYMEYTPDIIILLVTPSSIRTLNTDYDFFGDFQD